MEGYEDPFNRGTFPWGREDRMLQRRFALLGRLRRERVSLQMGELRWLHAQGHVLAFARDWGDETTVAAINVGKDAANVIVPWTGQLATDTITGQQFQPVGGYVILCLPPMDGMLLA